jgi:hypothetical protein
MVNIGAPDRAKQIYDSIFDEINQKENYCDISEQCKTLSKMYVDGIINSWKEDGNMRLDFGVVAYWDMVKIHIDKI